MMLQTFNGHVRAARRTPLPRALLRRPAPVSPGVPLRDGRMASAPPRATMNWLAIAVVGALHAVVLVALALSRVDLPVLTIAPALRVDLLPAAAPLPSPPSPPRPALDQPAPPLPVFVMPDIAPPEPAPSPVLAESRAAGGEAGTMTATDAGLPAAATAPDFEAAYLNNPAPVYPMASRRAREHGTVVLRVLVNPAGRAQTIELANSSGFSRLDKAARDAVERWRFVPASQDGRPVMAWVLVPVIFSLAR